MIISKNTVVSVHYRLKEGHAEGDLVEETFGGAPLTFLFGVGQMIPEFERQLEGKDAGEEFAFGINSGDAYGESDPEAVVMLPLSIFELDGKIDEDLLVVGNSVPMSDNEGNHLTGIVREVNDEGVLMDFNHPMAGKDLYFTGVVESVREATSEEIAHNHVHGPGGHHHH